MKKYPVVIGRFEHIDVVGKLENIPAKIDTGAYRSSIHASDIQVVKKQYKEILRFTLLGHPVFRRKRTLETRTFRKLKIKSSNGHVSERYEIMLKVRLGYKVFTTPFTLASRDENVFPVLVGRKAMNKRFLVDPDRAGMSRIELKLAAVKVHVDEEDMESL
jgi:hypothetical protein